MSKVLHDNYVDNNADVAGAMMIICQPVPQKQLN